MNLADERTIFAQAVGIPSPCERAGYLDRACAGKPELRTRIEALLAGHERASDFLEGPPPGLTRGISEITAAAQLPAEGPGTMVGPYKLLEQIGEGGMGVVFMAEQLRPVQRRVALKILKPGLDTKHVIARFEAERQALAMMEHPSIARVFDAGATAAGRPYFVMELVRGIPITEYCDQNRLTPRQRLELFIHVCQAVQHAHQKGIIHRDLKPTNVLVTLADDGKPVPKIIDFGIAKATGGQRLTEQTLFTEFRQLIGTPLYMSPEQAEMSAVQDVDTRSDVYSLGVLLYELLTGTTPFDKQRLAQAAYDEVRRIIREEEPPRPSTRVSTLGQTLTSICVQRQTDPKRLHQSVHGELDWIVMKALEKERGRRYETASAFSQDVGRFLSDQPVEAYPPSRVYRLRKTIRRNKPAIITAGVIVVVLVAATAVSSWQAVRAMRAEHELTRQRDLANALRVQAESRRKLAEAINLVARKQLREADNLIADVPAAHVGPEYVLLYRQLGDWNAGHGRFRQAADRFAAVLPVEQHDAEASRDCFKLGVLLLESGDKERYERLRRDAIPFYPRATDGQICERLLRTTLLTPPSADSIHALEPLARYLLDSIKPGSAGNLETWQLLAIGLWEYRRGDFSAAESCCLRARPREAPVPQRDSNVLALLAMVHFRQGKTQRARQELLQAQECLAEAVARGGAAQNDERWGWDFFGASILLREGQALIGGSQAATGQDARYPRATTQPATIPVVSRNPL